MEVFRPGIDRDRRKGPDLWIQFIRVLAVGGWILLVAALFVLAEARPPTETFFDRYHNIPIRSSWNLDLARYIFYLLVVGLAASVAGLAINLRRRRRRQDDLRVSLVLLGLISLFGIVKYLLTF